MVRESHTHSCRSVLTITFFSARSVVAPVTHVLSCTTERTNMRVMYRTAHEQYRRRASGEEAWGGQCSAEAHVEVGERLQLVLGAAPDAHGALLRHDEVAAAIAGARILDDLNHVAPLPPTCTLAYRCADSIISTLLHS